MFIYKNKNMKNDVKFTIIFLGGIILYWISELIIN